MNEAQLSMLETHDQRINEKANAAKRYARLFVTSATHLRWSEARKAFVAFIDHLASVRWELIRREQFIELSGRFRAYV